MLKNKKIVRTCSLFLTILLLTLGIVISFPKNTFANSSNTDNGIEFKQNNENLLDYYIFENGNKYHYIEKISTDYIDSKVYLVTANTEKLVKSINSKFSDNKVESVTTDVVSSKQESSVLEAELVNPQQEQEDENKDENLEISTYAYKEKFIKTKYFSTSLYGKKVSIGAVALAIAGVAKWIPNTIAANVVKIMCGSLGVAVAGLPNYIYGKTDIYHTGYPPSRQYTRRENKFYLDSSRRQQIASCTTRVRGWYYNL